MVVILDNEAVLLEEAGETLPRPGDVACLPAGALTVHHLQNRSGALCRFLAIGTDHIDIEQ